MERQLLIADSDGRLSDLYLTYLPAHGYSVRVASGGVECLIALREATPDVLVLDTELMWGGADGVLAVMDEEDALSTTPVVLLNEKVASDSSLTEVSVPTEEWITLKYGDQIAVPSSQDQSHKLRQGTQVVNRLDKPFRFQSLLDSIGTATVRPTQPR